MVIAGSGGVVIEQVLVQKYLSRPVKQMLRVRRGFYYADCATVAEGARLGDLATLRPQTGRAGPHLVRKKSARQP